MIDYRAIGAFISELRKANGLTQTELAEKLNVTHQAVSKWENGMTLPDTETLFALSKLFKVSIDYILRANRKEPQDDLVGKDYKSEDCFGNELTRRVSEAFGVTTDNFEENESPLGHLCGLAPFVSRELLEAQLKNIEKMELGNLIGLTPFLSREALDKAVDKIIDEKIDLGLVIALAPFISRDKLGKLIERVEEYDIGNIVGIAPFLHSSTIEKALRKIGVNNIDKGLLQGIAPFVSKEFLNELFLGKRIVNDSAGDIVKLEFGVGVIPCIKISENDNFLMKTRELRKNIKSETGKEIPLVHILDNIELKELQYRISVKGKVLIDNSLELLSPDDRANEMLLHLEYILKSHIDEIINTDVGMA